MKRQRPLNQLLQRELFTEVANVWEEQPSLVAQTMLGGAFAVEFLYMLWLNTYAQIQEAMHHPFDNMLDKSAQIYCKKMLFRGLWKFHGLTILICQLKMWPAAIFDEFGQVIGFTNDTARKIASMLGKFIPAGTVDCTDPEDHPCCYHSVNDEWNFSLQYDSQYRWNSYLDKCKAQKLSGTDDIPLKRLRLEDGSSFNLWAVDHLYIPIPNRPVVPEVARLERQKVFATTPSRPKLCEIDFVYFNAEGQQICPFTGKPKKRAIPFRLKALLEEDGQEVDDVRFSNVVQID